MNGPIQELDTAVEWRATQEDAMCAIPLDPTQCLGALSGLRRAQVHGLPVVEIDIKATSAYLKTEDGTVWHGIPDDNTAMLVAANDNPHYRPRGNVTFRVMAPTPSQTLDGNRDRVHKSVDRKRKGLPPVAEGRRGARPTTGRTLNMKPRGAVRVER